MSDQALTETVAQLMAQMAAMQAKIDSLQAQVQPTTLNVITAEDNSHNKPATPSRRRMLRRLAGGMLAGLAVGTVAAAGPDSAQARMLVEPDSSRRIGAIVVPPGTANPTGVPLGSAVAKYGLVATDGTFTPFNLATLPVSGTAVYGFGNNYGVYGDSFNVGVHGAGNNSGVHGTGTGTGIGAGTGVSGDGINYGVAAYSSSGVGVQADSGNGVPFRIVGGAQPTSPNRVYGDMYVDANGYLYIWCHDFNISTAGDRWRQVGFVS